MRSVFAIPTPETANRIRALLSSAPITLNFDHMVIPMMLNIQQDLKLSEEKFAGKVAWFGHYYNEELQHSQIIAVIHSPALVNRAQEWGAEEDYIPHWVIQNDATPLARTNKFWLASVATNLVDREAEPFTFTERVIDG